MIHRDNKALPNGMSVACRKLQQQLSALPLVPLNRALRKRRDKLVAKLLDLARAEFCVDAVNLNAGTVE